MTLKYKYYTWRRNLYRRSLQGQDGKPWTPWNLSKAQYARYERISLKWWAQRSKQKRKPLEEYSQEWRFFGVDVSEFTDLTFEDVSIEEVRAHISANHIKSPRHSLTVTEDTSKTVTWWDSGIFYQRVDADGGVTMVEVKILLDNGVPRPHTYQWLDKEIRDKAFRKFEEEHSVENS